jgi:hypothetical protein
MALAARGRASPVGETLGKVAVTTAIAGSLAASRDLIGQRHISHIVPEDWLCRVFPMGRNW